jgi:hypothetical protein
MSRRDFMPITSPEESILLKEWCKFIEQGLCLKHTEFYNPLPKYYQDVKVNGKKDKNQEG